VEKARKIRSSVATGGGRQVPPPNPNPARLWELPKSEETKIGLGEYWIIVAKYRGE